jgi:hypothetical protein
MANTIEAVLPMVKWSSVKIKKAFPGDLKNSVGTSQND